MGFSWIFIYFHYFHDFLLMDLQATGFHRLRGLHLLLGPHERAGLHRRHGDLPGPRGGPPSAAHAAPGALRARLTRVLKLCKLKSCASAVWGQKWLEVSGRFRAGNG